MLFRSNIEKCKFIATTEKDAVKLRNFNSLFEENGINCLVFPLKMEIVKGKELLLEKIQSLINKNQE